MKNLFTFIAFTAIVSTGCGQNSEGILINGVRWAESNVASAGTFAANPHDSGAHFTAFDDPCPAGWRMPTYDETESLTDPGKVTGEWVSENDTYGMRFTDRASQNSIFLPAAGYIEDGSLGERGTLNGEGVLGYYRGSTEYNSGMVTSLYFYGMGLYAGYDTRTFGFSIRCVAR